jgi:hypothetical protein
MSSASPTGESCSATGLSCLFLGARIRERRDRGLIRCDAGGRAGRIGTVAVALLWMKLFSALRDVERLE